MIGELQHEDRLVAKLDFGATMPRIAASGGVEASLSGWAVMAVLAAKGRAHISYPASTAVMLQNYAGALAMANYLGFANEDDLAAWAGRYPKLWGGSRGGTLFSKEGYRAFGKTRNSACTFGTVHVWLSRTSKVLRHSAECLMSEELIRRLGER
jgi:hypothetical protein